MKTRTALLVLTVICLLQPATMAKELQPIDYNAYYELLPHMKKSSEMANQSIKDLHESNNDFVAALILLFSVIVPFVKGAMLGAAALVKNPFHRYRLFAFVRSISKWAMADVFAMGVWVAYLASDAAENFDAEIGVGFYYFVAYCLVSLLALQFMSVPNPHNAVAADE